MAGKAIYTLLALLLLLPLASAIGVTPILSTASTACNQVNASYLMCPDGQPITVAFLVTTPYAPYYGTFTAYPADFFNESAPVDFYGNICALNSSQMKTCFVTLNPISPFQGNGTMKKTVTLRFVSSTYPEVSFNESFNITIQHNTTAAVQALVNTYETESGTYQQLNRTYAYPCQTYQVCNDSLRSSLLAIGNTLGDASMQLNESAIDAAYSNVTLAGREITAVQPQYNAFINTSTKVIDNVVRARSIVSNSTTQYTNNQARLDNCTFSNKTSYGTYVGANLKTLNAYPMQNTESGSEAYVNLAQNFSVKEQSLIKSCGGTVLAAPSLNVKVPGNLSSYAIYVVIAVIAAILAYGVMKLNAVMAAKAFSKKLDADRKKEEQPAPEAPTSGFLGSMGGLEAAAMPTPEPMPVPQPEPVAEPQQAPAKPEGDGMSLEKSFDDWLRQHIDKNTGGDISGKDASLEGTGGS